MKRPGDNIRAAQRFDLDVIRSLLERSGLPAGGVEDGLENFFVCENDGGKPVGAVGVERYGAEGLLRSTVVSEFVRGQGIGAALVERAVAHAGQSGCVALYLLTLDAERFFERFGFVTIPRDAAPAAIRGAAEFTTLCPTSATLMRKTLET